LSRPVVRARMLLLMLGVRMPNLMVSLSRGLPAVSGRIGRVPACSGVLG
jgi:hypothetical protein